MTFGGRCCTVACSICLFHSTRGLMFVERRTVQGRSLNKLQSSRQHLLILLSVRNVHDTGTSRKLVNYTIYSFSNEQWKQLDEWRIYKFYWVLLTPIVILQPRHWSMCSPTCRRQSDGALARGLGSSSHRPFKSSAFIRTFSWCRDTGLVWKLSCSAPKPITGCFYQLYMLVYYTYCLVSSSVMLSGL
jgi:hypothetical protein